MRDSRSDVTLINQALASKLNLGGHSEKLYICNAVFEVSEVRCKPAEFHISSISNSFHKKLQYLCSGQFKHLA